jgi:signal transduction histidine kinase
MKANGSSLPPQRRSLRRRIAWHFTLFALLLAVGLAAGAWFFLIEAEDASLESLFARTLEDQFSNPGEIQRWPSWIQRFDSPDALLEVLPISHVPEAGGPYAIFANDDRSEALLIDGWSARLQMWARGLELEYRLQIKRQVPSGPARYFVADWQVLEHTERIHGRLSKGLLLFGAIMGLLSLGLGQRLARSAIQPVFDLAEKVRHRHTGSAPLAAGAVDQETAFLAHTLDMAFAQLADANERERQFIADCSHELRTPLTILDGAVTLLADREGTDAAVLARLRRTTKRMEGIAQTFLVIAREGRVPGEPEQVPLRDLIVQVLAEQKLVYPQAPAQVRLSVPAEIHLLCVREVLHVILGNLIGNSFQHAPERPLWIQWRETVPPSLCLHAVEPSAEWEAAPSPVESRPSYGVGLSLVRRLCELQQWRIEADPVQAGQVTLWLADSSSRSAT